MLLFPMIGNQIDPRHTVVRGSRLHKLNEKWLRITVCEKKMVFLYLEKFYMNDKCEGRAVTFLEQCAKEMTSGY